VAKQLSVDGSAELVIISNYLASPVPVPSGVGTAGLRRLIQLIFVALFAPCVVRVAPS
jgi:hypothetical protein